MLLSWPKRKIIQTPKTRKRNTNILGYESYRWWFSVQQRNVFSDSSSTGVGKMFAPAYSNIYMASWEQTLIQKLTRRPSLFCFRYPSDVISGNWSHDVDTFKYFLEITTLPITSLKSSTDYSAGNLLATTVFFTPPSAEVISFSNTRTPTD